MGHQPPGQSGGPPLDAETARTVASTLQALATPSRLMLLATLREGPHTVSELVDAVEMEQSAVSHQLRHLRKLGFVVAERRGRHMVYNLFDSHVAELLDQAVFHADHVRQGRVDPSPSLTAAPTAG